MSINPSDAILAFRTTTTLLSNIQKRRVDFSNVRSVKDDALRGTRRRHLRLSVAFAILADINRDVVAVAAKPSIDLEVVVCSSSLDNNVENPTVLRWLLEYLPKNFTNLVLNINDRTSFRKSEYPCLIPCSPPDGLTKDSSAKELKTYVDKLW
jgi:hypothetical protein